MTRIGVIMLALLISACASYSSMLDSEPYKTVNIELNDSAASDCFHAEMVKSAGTDYTFMRIKDDRGYHVAGQIAAAGGGSDFVLFDVAFDKSTDQTSTAVIRAKIDVWGKPEIPDYLWPSLAKCGYHPWAAETSK